MKEPIQERIGSGAEYGDLMLRIKEFPPEVKELFGLLPDKIKKLLAGAASGESGIFARPAEKPDNYEKRQKEYRARNFYYEERDVAEMKRMEIELAIENALASLLESYGIKERLSADRILRPDREAYKGMAPAGEEIGKIMEEFWTSRTRGFARQYRQEYFRELREKHGDLLKAKRELRGRLDRLRRENHRSAKKTEEKYEREFGAGGDKEAELKGAENLLKSETKERKWEQALSCLLQRTNAAGFASYFSEALGDNGNGRKIAEGFRGEIKEAINAWLKRHAAERELIENAEIPEKLSAKSDMLVGRFGDLLDYFENTAHNRQEIDSDEAENNRLAIFREARVVLNLLNKLNK